MRYLGIALGSSLMKETVLNLGGLFLSQVERLETPAFASGLDPKFRETSADLVVQSVRQMLERLHKHARHGLAQPGNERVPKGKVIVVPCFNMGVARLRNRSSEARSNIPAKP
jgi:hypothetical protein